MKFTLVVALAMFGSVPLFAADQGACKAFFQVVRAEAGTPGLYPGLSLAQKKWWDRNQNKYPGLCLDGSVSSGDKPRYLVIWSKSKTIGQGPVTSNEVYGQTPSALQGTAPQAWIYRPRWDIASVTVVSVLYDGMAETPPVYLAAGDRALRALGPDSPRVLELAVKYLAQEPVFPYKVR